MWGCYACSSSSSRDGGGAAYIQLLLHAFLQPTPVSPPRPGAVAPHRPPVTANNATGDLSLKQIEIRRVTARNDRLNQSTRPPILRSWQSFSALSRNLNHNLPPLAPVPLPQLSSRIMFTRAHCISPIASSVASSSSSSSHIRCILANKTAVKICDPSL